MKKYYYSLFAAAAMLLATSCSQEEEVVQADNGVAKFSVSLQGATGSRAAGDGTQVDELIYEVYENGTNVYEGKEEVSAGKADVNIPLLRGHEYQIVFWAQNSEAGIYDAENLKAISVDYEKVTANNEAYDAFYNAITYTVEAGVTTVELTRPFAQLNVATTTADWEQAKDLLNDADPANKAQVTVNGLATTFDASTGTTSGDANVTFQAATFNGETLTSNETEYKVLAMNYLLVPGTKEEAKTTTTVGVALMNNESTALSFEVPNVPIQRNYRTNIVGNLFTQNGGFEVIVKPGFGEPDNNYPEIALAAKLGGTVILEGDVTLDDVMVVEKDLIINLNGNNLEGTKNDILFRVNDGATLTINGDGKVETKLYAASANAGGTIIVNGGEYICGTTCFQANGGKVYIKDGTFSVTSDDKKYILNHIDAQKDNGLIEVTGGTFYGFNPAASNSEYPAMDFVAYGYTVAYDAATDTYTVVENPLEQAVLAGETEITLTEDVTLHKSFVLEAGKQLTIDLAGKSIINTSNSEEFGEGEAIIAYGKLTLEGEGTVQANSMAVWARGTEGAEITINGGTYIGMADGLAKGGRSVIYASSGNTINIYGGTFEALTIDETSYADDLYAVLNVADNNGIINVYGGSFKNFNPAQPGTEPASWNTAHPNGFVVDGYKVKTSEDAEGNTIYTVVDEYSPDVVVSSADELITALAGSKKYIGLSDGTIYEGTFNITREVVISSNKDNKATIKGRVNITSATNVSIRNIKFDFNESSKEDFSEGYANSNPKGHPAIVGIYSTTTYFEECEFSFKSGYSIDKAPGAITHYGNNKLTLKDCKLQGTGNPIYAKTNVEMVGCTITMNGNNAVLSLNYVSPATVIFKGNTLINMNNSGSMYAIQFLSTNGTNFKDVYFDVQNNEGVDVCYAINPAWVINPTYAAGSEKVQ